MTIFVAFIVLIAAVGINASYEHKKGPRCYDCNYAPSGYVLSKSGYSGGHVGYLSCALTSDEDRDNVDKWGCDSGRCFIRRDYNGLVYRGCANDKNLPWGVDPHKQCEYQGDSQSLWWFCKGDLCNGDQLGSSPDMCGSAPPAMQQPYADLMKNTYQPAPHSNEAGHGNNDQGYGNVEDDNTNGGNGNVEGYDNTMDIHDNTESGYGNNQVQHSYDNANSGYQGNQPMQQSSYYDNVNAGYDANQNQAAPVGYGAKSGKAEVGYGFNDVQDFEYQQQPEAGTYLQISFDVDDVVGSSKNYGFADSMCTGDCSHNPTGLWAFPGGDKTRFIQCEAGHRNNDVCTCCKPTAINCPHGTLYDDKVKVCVGTESHLKGGLDGLVEYH